MRGMLTPEIQKKGEELLKGSFTVKHLRLLPYLLTLGIDQEPINHRRITFEESTIIDLWVDYGYLIESDAGLILSKEFYDAATQLLWDGYMIKPPQ